MKRSSPRKTIIRRPDSSGLLLKPKEKAAFLSAVEQMDRQCDRIGLLEPTGIEPAVSFSVLEDEK